MKIEKIWVIAEIDQPCRFSCYLPTADQNIRPEFGDKINVVKILVVKVAIKNFLFIIDYLMIQIPRLLKIGQKIKILSCNQILQIIPLYIVKKIFGYTKTTKIINSLFKNLTLKELWVN